MKRLAWIVAAALLGGYFIYSSVGKKGSPIAPQLHLQRTISDGAKRASESARNLLGVQPFMLTDDYASEARFEAKLDGYLQAAKTQGLIGQRTVVVFPEHIGTWLVAVDEKAALYDAPRIDQAMELLITNNLFSFLRWLPFSPGSDRVKSALFHVKAKRMADIYHRVFQRLAARYAITLVAGSIVLPSPRVDGGRIVAGSGALYNVAAVYGPSGALLEPLVRKAFPTAEEQPFLSAGAAAELPVFATPAGKLGVLICADSFYPAAYEALRKQGADLIAVPSYLTERGSWKKPWSGYGGAAAPGDVERADIGTLRESQAWFKYALAHRLRDAGAQAGVNVFLRGRLWDLGDDGPPYAVSVSGGLLLGSEESSAALINLWLN